MRLDKFLKISRIIKRRTVARDFAANERVLLNGRIAKPSSEVKKGDIIVAGRNFGCGSSREHAPLALTGAGIQMVVAQSFARIFYRNSINVGLLPVICPRASEISETDQVVPHLNEGYLDVSGKKLPTEPVPEFLRRIIDAGGLVAYAKTIRSEDLCIK